MTYDEAIAILESASKRKKLYPMYLRMERLGLLFAHLNIDPALPSVHIAGTSGKGSTSSLCAEILQKAGYRVGLHTTPHLQTPRERMLINGVMPSEETFVELVEIVWQATLAIESEHSYGAYNSQELLFTTAALYFKRMGVEIAVIETFMGGQYDPTNIIRPLVSVITNVDLDHTGLLGKTVESIAMVKAGVIKQLTPFITGAVQPTVQEIFQKRARDLDAPCFVIGEENKHNTRMLGLKGSILSVQVLDNLFSNLHLNLLGKHQINNAIMSLYIVQVLRSRGWLIPDTAIKQAFAEVFVPGRLEIVQNNPTIILDGAHNPAKVRALTVSLRRLFRNQKVIFVFATKRGKDLESMLKSLTPLAKKFIITRFSDHKSQSTKVIYDFIKQSGIPATIRLNPIEALALAKRQSKKDQLVCITGSLYLVGKLRSQWYPEGGTKTTLLDDTTWSNALGEPVRRTEVKRS